jgi:hypothetical protein
MKKALPFCASVSPRSTAPDNGLSRQVCHVRARREGGRAPSTRGLAHRKPVAWPSPVARHPPGVCTGRGHGALSAGAHAQAWRPSPTKRGAASAQQRPHARAAQSMGHPQCASGRCLAEGGGVGLVCRAVCWAASARLLGRKAGAIAQGDATTRASAPRAARSVRCGVSPGRHSASLSLRPALG